MAPEMARQPREPAAGLAAAAGRGAPAAGRGSGSTGAAPAAAPAAGTRRGAPAAAAAEGTAAEPGGGGSTALQNTQFNTHQ